MEAFRASLLHCLADPGEASDPNTWEYLIDGLLVVDDGRVKAAGEAHTLLPTCLLYTSPSPRDLSTSRMPSSA